jgi:pantoate--beta-alanine ligase
VVKRLFEIVNPDCAFFGVKDFQQLAVIRWMVNYYKIPIEIVGGNIIRDDNGLALSSRNERLSLNEKKSAIKLSESLFYIKEKYREIPFSSLQTTVLTKLNEDPNIKVEYLELADTIDLGPLENIEGANSAAVFIAAKVGDVRLIDNIILF